MPVRHDRHQATKFLQLNKATTTRVCDNGGVQLLKRLKSPSIKPYRVEAGIAPIESFERQSAFVRDLTSPKVLNERRASKPNQVRSEMCRESEREKMRINTCDDNVKYKYAVASHTPHAFRKSKHTTEYQVRKVKHRVPYYAPLQRVQIYFNKCLRGKFARSEIIHVTFKCLRLSKLDTNITSCVVKASSINTCVKQHSHDQQQYDMGNTPKTNRKTGCCCETHVRQPQGRNKLLRDGCYT